MKLLIFTYAPAGLGHLRVTDALVEGRPRNSPYVLLGSLDRFITWVHRYTSINPFGRFIFMAVQYGFVEDIFTWVYRRFLIFTAQGIYKELLKHIRQSAETKDVWIIATHFGMAHQIGAIKNRLIKETGRKVKLIVQVTDDTSQHIWCIKGADVTFVPSKYVKMELEKYAVKNGIDFFGEVIPYPLAHTLTRTLPKGKMSRHKVFAEKIGKVRVAIPISGAAVGLAYFSQLVRTLTSLSSRFEIWIVVKKTPFTGMFIRDMKKVPGVNVLEGKNDIQMIELYELLYEENLIHLEITKPSEQAFKSILYPTNVGGSILLFTSPVGRQEEDNIKFMERHQLLPSPRLGGTPRGIRISDNPVEAANFIFSSTKSGVFSQMTSPRFKFSKKTLVSGEVGPDGARLFWKKLEKKLGYTKAE